MNIVIADDHPLFRDALIILIKRLYPYVNILEAESFNALFDLLRDIDLNLVCLFLDLNMPGGNAYDHIFELRQRYKELPIIVITGSESEEDCRMAVNKGATRFLSKSLDSHNLEQVVMTTISGSAAFEKEKNNSQTETVPLHNNSVTGRLTKRQQEVFQLICQGDTNKMIANKLELTEGTVKLHVRAILQALGVSNRTQAVAMKKNN
ncbi:MAG: response regulator transcription factor [Proteobacteria bacterium]|nr:DNA-binding response regulator [Pseudomonadota bacterium]NOG59479.1 response regulator transcription factor [Pseudomonadota bacterium]